MRDRVDRPDGQPLRHAVVHVLHPDGEQADWARASSEGCWSVAVPKPGRYLVVCSADGWGPRSQLLEFSDGGDVVEVSVSERLTLPGSVSRDGEQVEGALVALTSPTGEFARSTFTDEEGYYRLALPPTGRYVMTVRDVVHGVAESQDFVLTAQQREVNVVIQGLQSDENG